LHLRRRRHLTLLRLTSGRTGRRRTAEVRTLGLLLRLNLLRLRRRATGLLGLLLWNSTTRLLRWRRWRSALAPLFAAILTFRLPPALLLLRRRRPIA
jgi:hypothetical protein